MYYAEPHYVEPLGVISGAEAIQLRQAGKALPLFGKEAEAFTFVRVWDEAHSQQENSSSLLYPVEGIPPQFMSSVTPLTVCPPMVGLGPGLQIMGILNMTPDSFSDGSSYIKREDAIKAAMDMVEQGAAIIDVGGESTRPGAREISVQEELERILPIIRYLVAQKIPISVDTRHAEVMDIVLKEGVFLINDVSGLTFDPQAASVVAKHKARVILMHMRGTPQTMMNYTSYSCSPVYHVAQSLALLVKKALFSGIPKENIMLDPGIGFAKTPQQDFSILKHLSMLGSLGMRLVLGVSRKKFIGSVVPKTIAAERDYGTLAACFPALSLQHTILRVHNVRALHQAVAVWRGMNG
ncbi:dihydropteroate synthase [Entomobacter blattae]|uniref:dihydropteroate synthase n=1 Tax=Entomobacter blattae TaxID=2762277 RepID=A0A7H1NTD2_9PROT|nr:dihydropteroate synthase [Entomobacter blattae]QNT79042.1 Pterin binding enzyme [Entomobacter blattae]